jgi:hypothetical protein
LLEKENEFVRAEFEALSENPEAALSLLEIALKKKLVDPGKIQSDPNFKSLHQDPLYQKLMGSTL